MEKEIHTYRVRYEQEGEVMADSPEEAQEKFANKLSELFHRFIFPDQIKVIWEESEDNLDAMIKDATERLKSKNTCDCDRVKPIIINNKQMYCCIDCGKLFTELDDQYIY